LDEKVAELEADLRAKVEGARLDQMHIKRLQKGLAACREGAADEVKGAVAMAKRAESRARDINHAAEVYAPSPPPHVLFWMVVVGNPSTSVRTRAALWNPGTVACALGATFQWRVR